MRSLRRIGLALLVVVVALVGGAADALLRFGQFHVVVGLQHWEDGGERHADARLRLHHRP